MRKKYLVITAMVISLAFGCVSNSPAKNIRDGQPVIKKGAELYTQVNMWSESGVVQPINHTKGIHIPVNTPVVIKSISRKRIQFFYKNSPKVVITVNNHQDYTGVDVQTFANRLFAPAPRDLSGFTSGERKFIQNYDGSYVQGLSKEAVLIGRGYPPVHRTNTIDLDIWRYWNSRWDSFRLSFKNGRTYSINEEVLDTGEETNQRTTSTEESGSPAVYRHGLETIPWFGFSWYLTGSGKVIAVDVDSDAPAANHILQGDQIIRINNTDVNSIHDIYYALYDLFPGQDIDATISRNGYILSARFASVTTEIVSHVNYIIKECINQEDVKIAIVIDNVEFSDLYNSDTTQESIESWEKAAVLNLRSIEENFLLSQFNGLDNFHIVDRTHTEEVIEEQKMSLTGLFAQASSIGQLLDASHILFVSMSREAKSNSDRYEDIISERLVSIETGKVVSTSMKVYENLAGSDPAREDPSLLVKIKGLFSDD